MKPWHPGAQEEVGSRSKLETEPLTDSVQEPFSGQPGKSGVLAPAFKAPAGMLLQHACLLQYKKEQT